MRILLIDEEFLRSVGAIRPRAGAAVAPMRALRRRTRRVLLPHLALHFFQLFGAANTDFVFVRLQTLRQPPAAGPNSCAKPANVGLTISKLLRMRYRR
jgi:hypothetical protein